MILWKNNIIIVKIDYINKNFQTIYLVNKCLYLARNEPIRAKLGSKFYMKRL